MHAGEDRSVFGCGWQRTLVQHNLGSIGIIQDARDGFIRGTWTIALEICRA